MAQRPHDKPALLVQVLAELGAGRITEEYVVDGAAAPEGYQRGRHIWVNAAAAITAIVIHELLHRLYPQWPEPYVKNRTTHLLKRMSHEQVEATYEAYQRIAKKKRRRHEGAARRSEILQAPRGDCGPPQPEKP